MSDDIMRGFAWLSGLVGVRAARRRWSCDVVAMAQARQVGPGVVVAVFGERGDVVDSVAGIRQPCA